jgi:porin
MTIPAKIVAVGGSSGFSGLLVRQEDLANETMRFCSYNCEKLALAMSLIDLSVCMASSVHAQAGDQDLSRAAEKGLWDQQYLFGDWGGTRSRLAKRGVKFEVFNIDDLQVDVTGSQAHHGAYFGRFYGSTDVDFNQLADFDGEFFSSAFWQFGQNLSGRYLHVNTLTSSIAGMETHRLDEFWYRQGFLNHLFTIQVGQIATVDEFGATDFSDILFNDELGYAPNALFQAKQPYSPAAKPGVVGWSDLSGLTRGLYAKAGIFAAYDNPFHPDKYGVDVNDDFDHGMVVSFELGYREPGTKYPGSFKIGINANDTSVYLDPSTEQRLRGNFTAYGLIEKAIYHPTDTFGRPFEKNGLDVLCEFLGAPGDRNNLEFEFTAGARYTGLIPGRDQDKTGLGIIYSKNGGAFSDAYAATHGHGLGGETTLEADYQINPLGWFSLQFDCQYIIDPGGDSQRTGIAVLGLRTIFRF